ncbi:DUF6538 domain-containing protein [Variovorax sp. Varisp41]|uniref:DUF6538 domain-containing protein n=1 Tax=Variovorax sp. Varisp41 TaxID=3243033 RepID=UPI0039B584BE
MFWRREPQCSTLQLKSLAIRRRPQASAPTSQRYLHRRGEVYYFKRKIPSDVPHAFGGKSETFWQSLKTDSLQEALQRLPEEIEQFVSAHP